MKVKDFREIEEIIEIRKKDNQKNVSKIKNMHIEYDDKASKIMEFIREKYAKMAEEEIKRALGEMKNGYNEQIFNLYLDKLSSTNNNNALENILKQCKDINMHSFMLKMVEETIKINGTWNACYIKTLNTEKKSLLSKLLNGKVQGGKMELALIINSDYADEIIKEINDSYKNSNVSLVIGGMSEDENNVTATLKELVKQNKCFVLATSFKHGMDAGSSKFQKEQDVVNIGDSNLYQWGIDNWQNLRKWHNVKVFDVERLVSSKYQMSEIETCAKCVVENMYNTILNNLDDHQQSVLEEALENSQNVQGLENKHELDEYTIK